MSKRLTITLTDAQHDRVLIHASRHKIKKPTTMATIIFEEGLDARDLLEAARKEEGERK